MSYNGEDKVHNFIDARNWCWETFGPSCEVDLVRRNIKRPSQIAAECEWAWKRDETHNTYFIYLTEKAYSAFILKWGGQ